MTISCDVIKQQLKTECLAFGESIGICTPFNLVNDKPLYAYFQELSSEFVRITDDGETLFEAINNLPTPKSNFVKSAENKLYGDRVKIINGSIQIDTPISDLSFAYSEFIQSCLFVTEYAHEAAEISAEAWDIISDIERIIAGYEGDYVIQKNVTVSAGKQAKARFPLQVNDTLIAAVQPKSQSTGSVLRRSAIVEKAGYAPPLIVIDDRDDPISAGREEYAISALCRTILYSKMRSSNTPLSL